jgi:hypothetical protein
MGGLNDPGTAHLIRGMALFRLKEYDGARHAFAKAHGYASTEKLAVQWQQYMKTEIARLAAME